jgi:enterochelin esterase family protein
VIPAAVFLFALAGPDGLHSFAELQASVARDPAGADASVRAFVASAGGTPIIEGGTAVFVVEGDPVAPPRVVGDWNAWGEGDTGLEASRLERLGSSAFFFRRVELPRAARVEYLIAAGEREIPDPLNPRRVEGFGGPQSELRMPGYAPAAGAEDEPGVPRGEVVRFEHQSAILSNSRHVHIYLPAGYDPRRGRRYPEAWLGDGTTYVQSVGVPRLLDRLIAQRRLEPLVAIFVDPADRRVEYDVHAGHRRMITEELVPRIVRDYRVEAKASRRALAGGSRGGQMALDLCLAAPEVFGLCGAWAPAVAPRNVAAFLGGRRTTSRFVLLRALYDDRFGPDAPALRDGLARLGARVDYLEEPQGHTLGAWPDLAARVLLALLPGERGGSEQERPPPESVRRSGEGALAPGRVRAPTSR